MCRNARLVVPNCAHHVVHRGHNGEPVFVSDNDHAYYLKNLWEYKQKFNCRVYAYCLIPSRVHLLVDPGNQPENLSRLIKHLAGRQARHINRCDSRSGSLWEGRFRSSPVSSAYLLPCSRYIELSPVHSHLAPGPDHYSWSSYRARIGQEETALDPYPAYLDMGKAKAERAQRYREYANAGIPREEWSFIRQSLQSGHLIGEPEFKTKVESQLGRRLDRRPRGRPSKRVVAA